MKLNIIHLVAAEIEYYADNLGGSYSGFIGHGDRNRADISISEKKYKWLDRDAPYYDLESAVVQAHIQNHTGY